MWSDSGKHLWTGVYHTSDRVNLNNSTLVTEIVRIVRIALIIIL